MSSGRRRESQQHFQALAPDLKRVTWSLRHLKVFTFSVKSQAKSSNQNRRLRDEGERAG